jgi:hypothetical protein
MLARYCPHLTTVGLPQALFLLDQSREVFYGGAAGGGKSDALLMGALQYVDVPDYSALILRRTFPQLRGSGGLISRATQWLSNSDAEWNERESTWTFPSGAKLRFGHCKDENNKYDYDGQEYQYVGFDELTHFTDSQYDWIGFSRTRRTVDIDVPVRTRASGTPTGVGYGWVKRRFITHRSEDVDFIPARVGDHPGLNPEEYAASLSRMPEETRKRLLEGDWDVFEGAAFADFDASVHVVPPFAIPRDWERFECMDFGVTNPTAWHAVASDYDGNLIVFDTLYGPGEDSAGKPTGGLPSEIAPLVLRKRAELWEQRDADGWKSTTNRVWADPSIRNTEGIAGRMGQRTSVMQEFADCGVGGLVPANNNRQAGYLRLAELIRPDAVRRFPAWHGRAGAEQSPRLFVFSGCRELIEQLQAAPLELEGKPLMGEAIAGDWESREGHAVAALRYGVLGRQGPSREPEPEPTDPRQALIERRARQRERQADDPNEFIEY